MPPIFCGDSVFVFVWYALLYVHSSFAIKMTRKLERAGCFAFIVFRMYCYCKCSMALSNGVTGWSAVCDCGISCSYSLTNSLDKYAALACNLRSLCHLGYPISYLLQGQTIMNWSKRRPKYHSTVTLTSRVT